MKEEKQNTTINVMSITGYLPIIFEYFLFQHSDHPIESMRFRQVSLMTTEECDVANVHVTFIFHRSSKNFQIGQTI